jgi:hypothetical protein
MDNMEKQLTETQALLRANEEEKRQRERDERLIATVTASVNPQIASLQQQVSEVTAALQSKTNEPPPRQEPTAEMLSITRQLDDFKTSLAQKEKTGLNLTDLDTVMTTIETIEKRIRKEVPAGEFDWKATSISTLGEIGKEVVDAFKELQQTKNQQMGPPGQPGAAPTSAANSKLVAKQKLQSYILQNLSKGIAELRMDEAQKDLRLAPQEILEAYNELVVEGWIKGKPDGNKPGQPQNQPPQPQPAQTQQQPQPQPPQQPNAYDEAVKTLHPGEVPRDRFAADSPFLER